MNFYEWIFHLSSLWNRILSGGLVIIGLVSQCWVGRLVGGWVSKWLVAGWSVVGEFNKTPPSNPRTWKTNHLNLSMTVSLSKNCGLFTSYYGMTLQQVVEVKGQLARTRCHEFNSSALQSRWNKKERHRKT